MALPDFTQVQIKGVESKNIIIELVRAGLTAQGYGLDKIVVLGSDPHLEKYIPCVGINRTNDSLDGDSLAQSEVSWFDDVTGKWMEQVAPYYAESLELRVWSKNSDERDKLAGLVKGILTASVRYLADDQTGPAFVKITIGGGRDEQENITQFGHPLFFSTISLYFWNPLEVTTITTDPTIGQVNVKKG